MNERIIYPTPDGGLAVLIPSTECNLLIEEIAKKDVPQNTPYKILNASDVPSDRTWREAWEADFSSPDGYGIGHEAWFAEKAAKEASKVEDDTHGDTP